MSNGNTAFEAAEPRDQSQASTEGGARETVDTAKQEAGEVAHTAADAASNVASTAKDEVHSLGSEAKAQAKDLFGQARSELSGQASQQQQRLADGLTSIGDELGSMSSSTEGSGLGAQLVQEASTRLSAAGTWLADRDPASLLDEVKAFARRRPVVFIVGAAVAGIVVGRLTRALASAQHDEKTSGASGTPALPASASVPPVPPVPAPAAATAAPVYDDTLPVDPITPGASEDSPLYTQSTERLNTDPEEAPYERRDTF